MIETIPGSEKWLVSVKANTTAMAKAGTMPIHNVGFRIRIFLYPAHSAPAINTKPKTPKLRGKPIITIIFSCFKISNLGFIKMKYNSLILECHHIM